MAMPSRANRGPNNNKPNHNTNKWGYTAQLPQPFQSRWHSRGEWQAGRQAGRQASLIS